MIILWKADYDGGKGELESIDRKMKELSKKHGFQVEGPFLPQDASLLYIFRGTLEQMSASGREFLPWLESEGIPLNPLRYEIAQTPEEFWGR
ncbi:MAG: hypothetical protein ACT4PT_08375 [Methanobacteriota archaeon]